MMFIAGCGHTDEEMAGKDQRIAKLTADLGLARAQLADDKATFDQSWAEVFRLHDEVQRLAGASMGCSIGPDGGRR